MCSHTADKETAPATLTGNGNACGIIVHIPNTKAPPQEDAIISQYDKYAIETALWKLPDLLRKATILYYFDELECVYPGTEKIIGLLKNLAQKSPPFFFAK